MEEKYLKNFLLMNRQISKISNFGENQSFSAFFEKKLPLINRFGHWVLTYTKSKAYSFSKFYMKSILCQFWGFGGFSLKVSDFDEIRHFQKMTRHHQTGRTTNKCHIPEWSGRPGNIYLLWKFEIGHSNLFVFYDAKLAKIACFL